MLRPYSKMTFFSLEYSCYLHGYVSWWRLRFHCHQFYWTQYKVRMTVILSFLGLKHWSCTIKAKGGMHWNKFSHIRHRQCFLQNLTDVQTLRVTGLKRGKTRGSMPPFVAVSLLLVKKMARVVFLANHKANLCGWRKPRENACEQNGIWMFWGQE